MKTLQKQCGMGLLSLILVIVVCAFCGTFAFKVVPIYAENRYIISGLKELVDAGTNLEQMSDAEIKKKMNNFYTINNVRSKEAQNIVVSRSVNRVIVKIDYESRATFFSNIDVVVSFVNHLDSAHPHECCNAVAVEEVSAKY